MRLALLALLLTGCAMVNEPHVPPPGATTAVWSCTLYLGCQQVYMTPVGPSIYGDFVNPKRP